MKHVLTASVLLLHALSGAQPAHTAESAPEYVESLVRPYLTIQTALAADDLVEARSGATDLEETLRAHDPIDSDWHEPLRIVRESQDLESARRGFKTLTHRMLRVVREASSTIDMPLYLVHCPMAFDGTGGSWIQADETIANPYYGSAMLRCGAVQDRLTGKPESSHEGSSAGHDHADRQH